MAALCAVLGDPHLDVPAIRVVGTDGKTSVARLLGSCFEHLGVRAGVTTSPHLQDVTERIAIGSRAIAPDVLAPALARVIDVLPAVDRAVGERVTFFEAITACALEVFRTAAVDTVVVEAGIGGIGDATAVVPARVVALTPVGLDHPVLGATRAEVACEKAATLTRGGTLVSGPQAREVVDVLTEIVADRRAGWSRHGIDHGVAWRRPTVDGQRLGVTGAWGELAAWTPLHGGHQAANVATALAALHAHLDDLDLSWDAAALRAALTAVRVPGRTEVLHTAGGVEVVLDGAHDLPAIEALVATLSPRPVPGVTTVVVGRRGARDVAPWLEALRRVATSFVVVDAGHEPTRNADEIIRVLRETGCQVSTASEAGRALCDSLAVRGPGDRIVVTGSLHLVGDVRAALVASEASAPGPPRRLVAAS